MFKEVVIPKRKKILVTLSRGGLYTNSEYTLVYIGCSPSGMSAEFKMIHTDTPSDLRAMGSNGKPHMEFIASLVRVLLC